MRRLLLMLILCLMVGGCVTPPAGEKWPYRGDPTGPNGEKIEPRWNLQEVPDAITFLD